MGIRIGLASIFLTDTFMCYMVELSLVIMGLVSYRKCA